MPHSRQSRETMELVAWEGHFLWNLYIGYRRYSSAATRTVTPYLNFENVVSGLFLKITANISKL